MSRPFSLAAALLLFGCSYATKEPSMEALISALPECSGGACKDFQKISCQNAGDPDGMNGGLFKCRFSYVLAASASSGVKTDEKCFINEGVWRLAGGPCP